MKIQIPATIEEATATLGGIGQLLTAKQWERAAIVYAFTRNELGRGDKVTTSRDIRLPVKSFAALGITGLTTQDTVRNYRTIWAEHGDTNIAPGAEASMPELDWPGVESRPNDHRLGAMDLSKLPAEVKRQKFTQLAADPDVTNDLETRAEASRQLEAATGRATTQRQRRDDAATKPIRESFELLLALGAVSAIQDKAAYVGRVWREHAEAWTEEERDTVREGWADAVKEIGYTGQSLASDTDWSMAELEA